MISEKYVLSAAHCFLDQGVRLDQKKMEILAGSFDPTNPEEARKKARFIERKKIRDVKIHPEFVYPAAAYDLALVKIEGQFNFRDTRWPICLPEISAPRDSHSRIGFILLGFGRDTSAENQGSVLTELDLTVQPVAACSTLYGKILDDEYDDLYTQTKMTLPKSFEEDSLICAQKPGRNSGSCPGDSGGIFMKNEWVNSLEDYRQSHYIEVVQGDIFMEQNMRFGMILGQLAILKCLL
jgi:secreted trypsin-like serine protease